MGVVVDFTGRRFTFNGDNKQTQVKDAQNRLVGKYFYDGEGKRVKKLTYDQYGVEKDVTVFIYSSGKLIAEYTTEAPPTNPTTRFTITDQLGSPRVILDSAGDVVSRRDFLPFGEEIAPDTTYRTDALKYGRTDNVRQKFTGYQNDAETGLDFAEARMYENRHGRFTAVDPLLASGKSADPQTFNRYVYVINNPLILTDPNGLQAGRQNIPPPRVIDVFIVLKMTNNGQPERTSGGNVLPVPDWKGLQREAERANVQVNVFTEDQGNPSSRLLKSLQTPNRTVIFAGHSWTDGKIKDGEIVPGNGIRTGEGDAIGTFGVTTRKRDKEGKAYGEYSQIPKIQASTFMVFACSPGSDFDDVLQPQLSPNSTVYYNDAGEFGQTWVPTSETAAFEAAKIMVATNDPQQAVKKANEVLKNQMFGHADGDKMQTIRPKP